MNEITPITVEDFTIDHGYSNSMINLEHLFALEQISRKNLREFGGTLGLTFFDMLKVLQKHNIKPDDICIYVVGKFFTRDLLEDDEEDEKEYPGEKYIVFEVEEIYGYCLCYDYDDDKVQIAHLCIDPRYQRMGFGQMLLEKAGYNRRKTVTADVYYDNERSANFFKKNGFSFIENEEKKRWRVIRKVVTEKI